MKSPARLASAAYFKVIDLLPDSLKWRLARTSLVTFYRRLTPWLGRGLGDGLHRIDSGPLAGYWINLESGAARGYPSIRQYQKGSYEPLVAAVIDRYCRPGAVVCDIGAHLGYFSLLMAQRIGRNGLCLAFEPNQANYARLMQTVAANRLDNLRVVPAAVAAQSGPIRFAVHANSLMGHLHDPADNGAAPGEVLHYDTVSAVSLDDYWSENSFPALTFIKIDVEGAEETVLQGAEGLLRAQRPVLLIEVHHSADSHHAPRLGQWLASLGYHLFTLADQPIPPADLTPGHVLALPAQEASPPTL